MKNDLFITTVSIITNIVFILGFLIIFYFAYVVNVEQQTFSSQMNIIVDNILNDVKNQNLYEPINSDNEKVIIYGLIDTAQEKIKLSTRTEADQISSKNNELQINVFTFFGIILGVLLLFFIIFRKSIPYLHIIKQTFIIIFFIGLTEVIFLTFISSQYISSDPNKVKFMIGNAVTKWIKTNKPEIV